MNQIYRDFELILLDDGSTDRSGTICDEYAKKDPRIHVIHQENKGVSDSWNEAMKHVRGEYTGFVDGDDLIHPRMYELLIRAIQDTGCEVAYCDYKKFSEEKDTDLFQDNQTDQENDGELIYISTNELANNISFPSIWRGLYKTELIRNIQFISGRNNQGFLWSANALLKAGKVARVDKVLYGWRKRPGSETEVGIRRRLLDYLEAKRLTVETIKESAPEWTVPYTVAMFASCLNAAGRLPQLSDPFERKKYQEEINKALNYFSQISILDILMDPYSKRRRKLIAVTGKISFPLACSLKRFFLKIVDR